jgi:type 2 lantibiotic biosynthesis protein LanM
MINATEIRNPTWYRGISLSERIPSLPAVDGMGGAATVAPAVGERRIERWRSQPPFNSVKFFAQRLSMDGMTEEELRFLLAEPAESLRDRLPSPPVWLAAVLEAYDRQNVSASAIRTFASAVEPLIQRGRDLLDQELQPLFRQQSGLPVDPNSIGDILFAGLPAYLNQMLSRTMVLELNVARVEGRLRGENPEERFQSFMEIISDRESVFAIMREYPVLARTLADCVESWATAGVEFVRRLCSDWDVIRDTFAAGINPGTIDVVSEAGDRHRGGRCVMIAKLTSGLRIVYKPRPLAVDQHFQDLLQWLNDRGQNPPFRTLKIVDRGTYGWMEFVSADSCSAPDEVQRFYERQGAYLALLYSLQATDFHSENLLAAGEHPVLLDLEALFHPQIHQYEFNYAGELAAANLAHSVQGVGLLPVRIWLNAEGEGIDLSGLGAAAGQLTPAAVPQWEAVATDEMRMVRNRIPYPGERNQPRLNGRSVDVLAYSDAITAGFAAMYSLLLDHSEELLAPGGPIAGFAGDEVRVILRNTRTYAILQQESLHPDALRDALDRDRLFDRLWVAVEYRPYLSRVIRTERDDLWRGDIPMFTTRPDSQDIWTSSGERIPNFIAETGLSLTTRRIQRLSAGDLEQQLWVIRASLVTLVAEGHTMSPLIRQTPPAPPAGVDRQYLLSQARAIGQRLASLAVRGDGDVSWIGLEFRNERQWFVVPLGNDLYDGLPGIALFLAWLGEVTCEEQHNALARAAMATVRRQIGYAHYMTSIGGFAGLGGVIYALTHLAMLWNEPELLHEAEELVGRLQEFIDRDEESDIIAGAAGCIAALHGLYQCSRSNHTLAAMLQCGDRLLARTVRAEHGVGWPSKHANGKPLTGLSHGAAGVAWQLLELYALTADERFQAAAKEAIAYERSLYCQVAGNWPDLRVENTSVQPRQSGQPRFMTAWCHGAAGIGLARLRSLHYLDDSFMREEISTALRTTVASGFGHNHSLCHGDFGKLDFVLQAARTDEFANWQPEVDRLACKITQSVQRDGWLCGNPLAIESPGLMTGLAGIGYGLLRLIEPARVPSVLSLGLPCGALQDASRG